MSSASTVCGSSSPDSKADESGCVHADSFKVAKLSKLPAVPDYNGVRFCKACNKFLPICEFPNGQKRYTCKTHLWLRVGSKAAKRLLANPRKKLLTHMWTQCYKDLRRLARCLGLDALDKSQMLTQADIGSMLDASADLEREGSQLPDPMAVLPVNLMEPLSTTNAALVTKDERQRLFDKLRSVGGPVGGCGAPLESVWRAHIESVRLRPRDMNRR
jgi:hypothetical protein